MRKSNLQSILLGETVKKKMAMFASRQIFAYSRATPSLPFDSILKEDKNITILSVCPKGVPKPDLKGSEIFNLLFFSLSFYYSIMLTFSSFLFYISKSEKLILYLPIFYFKIVVPRFFQSSKTSDVFARHKFVFGRRTIPDRSILGSGCVAIHAEKSNSPVSLCSSEKANEPRTRARTIGLCMHKGSRARDDGVQ